MRARVGAAALAVSLLPALCAAEDAWHMRPVTSIQARVETFAPIWFPEQKAWVSGLNGADAPMTFEERYAATLDSVTTSSVEGALMYLQRDCIDIGASPQKAGCQRKNDVKVITFLEVQIVNPNAALAEYQSDRYTYPEFCPFVEMKDGLCVYTNDTSANITVVANPPECKQFNGLEGQPKIGPCVGAEAFPTDNIAPYFDTVWFSYPNSCVMKTWAEGKTAECRKENPGGLCPFGKAPDGVECSFSYKILGYLLIDDLVGITTMERTANDNLDGDDGSTISENDLLDEDDEDGSVQGEAGASGSGSADGLDAGSSPFYTNYTDFCMDNNTEFHTFDKDKTLGLRDVESIDFWGYPSDHRVNKNRTAFMIAMYNKMADPATNNMQPLPLDLDALTKANPPCYENALACYNAHYGCVRHSYAQVCSLCREMGAKCVVKVPAYTFPTLTKVPREVSDSELRSRKVKAANEKNTNAATRGAGLVTSSIVLLATVITASAISMLSSIL